MTIQSRLRKGDQREVCDLPKAVKSGLDSRVHDCIIPVLSTFGSNAASCLLSSCVHLEHCPNYLTLSHGGFKAPVPLLLQRLSLPPWWHFQEPRIQTLPLGICPSSSLPCTFCLSHPTGISRPLVSLFSQSVGALMMSHVCSPWSLISVKFWAPCFSVFSLVHLASYHRWCFPGG